MDGVPDGSPEEVRLWEAGLSNRALALALALPSGSTSGSNRSGSMSMSEPSQYMSSSGSMSENKFTPVPASDASSRTYPISEMSSVRADSPDRLAPSEVLSSS